MNQAASGRAWIGRTEVLERLGVKPQTLYAYVSRGRIAARADPDDPRRSLYAAEDIDRLLERSGRSLRTPDGTNGQHSRGEAVIDSALGGVVAGRPLCRSEDLVLLSQTATLEQAARLHWGGDEDPFIDLKPRVDVSFAGGLRGRAFACLSRRAEEDAASLGRSQRSLRREAAAVLNEMVDSISGGGPRLYLHQRLARSFKLEERDAHLIRRALVLCIDLDATAPVMAARTAASTGAPLSACALAGLCAMLGPVVTGKLAQVTAFVSEARRGADPRAVARQRLAQGLEIPGFGHARYPDGDPRARALIEGAGLQEDLLELVRVGEGLTGEPPGLEMALALVSRQLDLPRDGAFALMAVGATVGWLGHALEQIAAGAPPRARLRYVGDGLRAPAEVEGGGGD